MQILLHFASFNQSSKNQLKFLQRAYQQRVVEDPHQTHRHPPTRSSSRRQAAETMDQGPQAGMNHPITISEARDMTNWGISGPIDNAFQMWTSESDFTADGFGFFDSTNFLDGDLPPFGS